MKEKLPKGWIGIELKNCFEIKYGKGLPKSKRKGRTFPVYGSNGIVGFHNQSLTLGMAIIIGRKGSVGKINFSKRPCWPIDTTYYIDTFDLFIPTFAHYLLHELKLFKLESSSAIPGINREKIYKLRAPLPPLSEQHRISARLDKLMPRIDAVRDRLSGIPRLIKRFRQSVLNAAVTGKLTEKWREQHPEVESAEILLEKIKNFRIQKAGVSQELNKLLKYFEEGDKRLKTKKPPYDLPNTWKYCEINNIGNVCNGSTPSRKINAYWGNDINWVSSGEVQNCIISKTKEKISKLGFEKSSIKLLPKGTVLIAMIGEGKTRGQTAILDVEATCNQNVAAVIIDHNYVLSKYIFHWFFLQYEKNRNIGSGSGPKALNCQKVRELDFILPPLEEQKEIVRQVDQLFSFADKLERHYQKAKEKLDKLPQSVLAKAFRGELVPTEAELAREEGRDYETAQQLLERIKTGKKRLEQELKKNKSSRSP
jgi:type I restriction enzyme S subunit